MEIPDAKFSTRIVTIDGDCYLPIPDELCFEEGDKPGQAVTVTVNLLDGLSEPAQLTWTQDHSQHKENGKSNSDRQTLDQLATAEKGLGSRDTGNGQEPPLSEGETLTLAVTESGKDGDGIAFVDGYAVIVEGAQPGNDYEVTVDTVKSNYAFATPLTK
jgi:predicted RNA-binding protein with TRAM domain